MSTRILLRRVFRALMYQRELVLNRLGLWKHASPPHFYKREIILRYASRYRTRILVETGTLYGDMVAAMSGSFEEIHSVELSDDLYRDALIRFHGRHNIHLYHGDSTTVLPEILRTCKERSLFWLDAHYSGPGTAKGRTETPIESELSAILGHAIQNHVILIDDAGLFGADSEYPSMETLRRMLETHTGEHTISIEQNIIKILPSC